MNPIKYPRTPHAPWSPGRAPDDELLADMIHFIGKEVVVSVKMDGENVSLYRDGLHSRGLDFQPHPSRQWIRQFHARVRWQIPVGWRVCGESLYAVHSIRYTGLPDYFLVISIWDEANVCLPWDETLEWCALLELRTVPVLFRGAWDEARIRSLWKENQPDRFGPESEGYVIRRAERFAYAEFPRCVAKVVRSGHVKTDDHWLSKPVEVNGLAGDAAGS